MHMLMKVRHYYDQGGMKLKVDQFVVLMHKTGWMFPVQGFFYDRLYVVKNCN